MEPKQVIVMRKDLNMRKGKIAAQAAHASLSVILDQMKYATHGVASYTKTLTLYRDDALTKWLEDSFTKICVYVESEEELFEIYEKARKAEIPCSLITDSGRTEFNGVPTVTCCAIGPDWSDTIDSITGHLPLY